MKVGDAIDAMEKLGEINTAVKKIGAYVSMYGEKGEVHPVNLNVAIEVIRRAVLQASMPKLNPNSEQGKYEMAQIAELADLYLDMCDGNNVSIRSKDHSHLPDDVELELGDN